MGTGGWLAMACCSVKKEQPPILVKAVRDPQLQFLVGQTVVKINDSDITDWSYDDALQLIREAQASLVIEFATSSGSETVHTFECPTSAAARSGSHWVGLRLQQAEIEDGRGSAIIVDEAELQQEPITAATTEPSVERNATADPTVFAAEAPAAETQPKAAPAALAEGEELENEVKELDKRETEEAAVLAEDKLAEEAPEQED